MVLVLDCGKEKGWCMDEWVFCSLSTCACELLVCVMLVPMVRAAWRLLLAYHALAALYTGQPFELDNALKYLKEADLVLQLGQELWRQLPNLTSSCYINYTSPSPPPSDPGPRNVRICGCECEPRRGIVGIGGGQNCAYGATDPSA